ncbi:MAG: hypothetical protein ACD_39C01926G0002 [uncultured bacterium]|nr:MAG: hypothetical protein ACD_39C01926G0002 [uncultured bacterium]
MRLEPKFDGDCRLNVGEFAGMIAGVLVHFNRAEILGELNAICEKAGPGRTFDRKLLARLLAIMLRNLTHLYPSIDEQRQISYTDVKPGSDLAYDLEAIGHYGIQLGYVGGQFAGDEKITRFEAVGTLYAAIEPLISKAPGRLPVAMQSPEAGSKQTHGLWDQSEIVDAKKEVDIDDFVARIREKQKRIREILERRRN